MMICEQHRQTEGTKVYPGQQCPWCQRDALLLQVDGLKKETDRLYDSEQRLAQELTVADRLNQELQNKLAELIPVATAARDFWASDKGDTEAEQRLFGAVEKFEGKEGNDLLLWDIQLSKSQNRKCQVCGTAEKNYGDRQVGSICPNCNGMCG